MREHKYVELECENHKATSSATGHREIIDKYMQVISLQKWVQTVKLDEYRLMPKLYNGSNIR